MSMVQGRRVTEEERERVSKRRREKNTEGCPGRGSPE